MRSESASEPYFKIVVVAVVGAALGALAGLLMLLLLRYGTDLFFAALGLFGGSENTQAHQAMEVRESWQGLAGSVVVYLAPALGALWLLKKEWPTIWNSGHTNRP